MYTHPFFEATPPGAAPGPPVNTGARVRHFRGCNKASDQEPLLIHELGHLFQLQLWGSSHVLTSGPRGRRGVPIKGLSLELMPSSAVATRIRFLCELFPLPESHRELVFGYVSRGTWVGETRSAMRRARSVA